MDNIKFQNVKPEFIFINNDFIEKELPNVDGNVLKVYLYFSYCMNTGASKDTEAIAKFCNMSPSTVEYSIKYWEDRGFLTREDIDEETTLINVSNKKNEKKTTTSEKTEKPEKPEKSEKSKVKACDYKKATPPSKIPQDIAGITEKQFGITINYNNNETIKNIIDNINPIGDAYEAYSMLLDYYVFAKPEGKTLKEFEKYAIFCNELGINSEESLRKVFTENRDVRIKIKKILDTDYLSTTQEKMVCSWIMAGYNADSILEAFRRMAIKGKATTAQGKFSYAAKIIESWQSKGLTTLKAIEAEDPFRDGNNNASDTSKPRNKASFNTENSANYDLISINKLRIKNGLDPIEEKDMR